MCAGFDYQPIYTVYLQYPSGAHLPFPMIGLSGGHAQWVLDRGALEGQDGLLAVVISAEGRHQTLTQNLLAIEVASELAQAFPDLPPPEWHKVIAEKRATFTCRPSLSRPAQCTPMANLYLAGDHTAGDYPATIEGAVRSGVKCAKLILEGAA
jgi:predicted NAD/FAD-dependent oxidoreductase